MPTTRRPSARPIAPRSRKQPKIIGRTLRLGNRRIPLHSGAMHYWRVPRDAWRPALHEIRNMGLPIVETYAPWAVHEIVPGEFDFGEHDASKDLGAFLDLAAEEELLAFVRPGPHINAEMTYFGLPERIIYDKACQARSPRQNPVVLGFPPQMFPVPSYASTNYHAEAGRWYDAVGRIIAPRIYPDGPVVLLQVDNEAAYYFRNAPYDQDYHPDAIALWKQFLERRYGSLEDVARAHRQRYATWDDVLAPLRFDADAPDALVVHLDWAAFQEEMITHALSRMRERMAQAGMKGVPILHNLPLGDGGLPLSLPAISRVVDLVGLDYYHPAREHRTIRRRTLYLAGTVEAAYAPELGVGAPPWFTPLAHEDSLFCAMSACAYGLRGFNLYMAVDRDRWYGAPIDAQGTPRVEAGAWKHLLGKLQEVAFHELERKVEVALMVPREYARLSRATHVLGPLSPSTLEAFGGTPVDACREDNLGFVGPVQVLWWRMLAKVSDALTNAGIPYVYIDSDASPERYEGMRLVVAPSYEFASVSRWKLVADLARHGATVVYGPAMPTLDDVMRPHPFEVPREGRKVLLDTPEDAEELIAELIEELDLVAPFRASPAPVETALHENGAGPVVLFVIHPGARPVEASIEVPEPTLLEDVMSGEKFSGDYNVQVAMEPRTCRMFLLRSVATPSAAARRTPRAMRVRARRSES